MRERQGGLSGASSFDPNPLPAGSDQGLTLMPSFNLKYLFIGSSSTTAALGVRASVYEFGRDPFQSTEEPHREAAS